MSITKGDRLTVINDDPSLEWTLCELGGQRGYVPTNYLRAVLLRKKPNVDGVGDAVASSATVIA